MTSRMFTMHTGHTCQGHDERGRCERRDLAGPVPDFVSRRRVDSYLDHRVHGARPCAVDLRCHGRGRRAFVRAHARCRRDAVEPWK